MNIADFIIITLLIGGGGTTWYLAYLWNRDKFGIKLEQRLKIYERMNEILQQTGANRVLIWKTKNGNSIPRLDHTIHVEIMYEDFTVGLEPLRRKYHNFPVGPQLNRILVDVHQQGARNVEANLVTPSPIKTLYDTEGIVFTQIFKVKETKRYMIVISVHCEEDGVELLTSDSSQLRLSILIDSIKRYFNGRL